MIKHYGKTFQKYTSIDGKKIMVYESICKNKNIPKDDITYTATKITCKECLLVLRDRRESEIRNINMRIMEINFRSQELLEIAT